MPAEFLLTGSVWQVVKDGSDVGVDQDRTVVSGWSAKLVSNYPAAFPLPDGSDIVYITRRKITLLSDGQITEDGVNPGVSLTAGSDLFGDTPLQWTITPGWVTLADGRRFRPGSWTFNAASDGETLALGDATPVAAQGMASNPRGAPGAPVDDVLYNSGTSNVEFYVRGEVIGTLALSVLLTAISGGAPGALDTLNELAAALGDDANFATTVTNALAGKPSRAEAAAVWTSSTIAAIGDSWTEGNQDGSGTTYPGLLATALPWATVTNAGHSGWTSTELAALWGAPFTLGAFTTATDATTWTTVSIAAPTTAYRVSSSLTMTWVGELRLASGVIIPGTLRHVASSATWSDGWAFQRAGAGTAVSIPAGSLFVCTQQDALKAATLIISVGRNNFTATNAPEVIVRDVNAIRAAHRAPGAPFAVLAVPTAITETAGTVPYARIKRVNAALKAAFPREFTDTRRYLIDRGLVATATTPISADLDEVIADTIPQSLMIVAGDHPNATGYKAIAACILDSLSRVGALPGPSAGVPGVTTTATGPMIWSANDVVDPLGSQINNILDRTGYTVLQAASTSAAPTLSYDPASGRRYLSFDGTDDSMYGLTGGDVSQPFTVIAKARFRDLSTFAQGVVWTYDTPGATFSVSTSGRVILNAASNVQTATGAVVQGVPTTVAGVANGASSAAGIGGSALTTGDAGTRGLVTQLRVGYYFDTAARYASMDLFELRVYPWALSEAQVTAVSKQIDLAVPLASTSGGTGAVGITGLAKGNGASPMTAAVAGTDYVAPVGAQGSSIQLYNTTDQVTNYERVCLRWASNIARLISENGGTGAKRTVSMESFGFIRVYGSAQDPTLGTVQLSINSSTPGGTIAGVNGILNAGSTGVPQVGLSISPTISQDVTKAVGYTALLINVTETTVGAGAKSLILAQVGGVNKFAVDNSGNALVMGTFDLGATSDTTVSRISAGQIGVEGNPIATKVSVPASASAAGVVGQYAVDASFHYDCIATNTWVRSAVATW